MLHLSWAPRYAVQRSSCGYRTIPWGGRVKSFSRPMTPIVIGLFVSPVGTRGQKKTETQTACTYGAPIVEPIGLFH
jgi:hypothetical protein